MTCRKLSNSGVVEVVSVAQFSTTCTAGSVFINIATARQFLACLECPESKV